MLRNYHETTSNILVFIHNIPRKDRINLLSYGSKLPESNIFKIVKLFLGRGRDHRSKKLEAIVVNAINPVCMPGASAFAKKLEKKGYSLADERLVRTKDDCVQIDILIGADHYINFVSPIKPKVQLYGMWMEHTYWDEILLNGPIPGSAASPNQGVNMTCIYNVGSPSGSILQLDVGSLDCKDLDEARELNSLDTLGIHNTDNVDKPVEV